MTDEDRTAPSRREIKKAAKALKAKGNWDVKRDLAGRESAQERLENKAAEMRSERAYAHARECPECDATKKALNDVTALCEIHLEEAMGL